MDHDEIRESLAVFALGAMEPGEQAVIDGHLVDCEACRAEITVLRRTVSLLGPRGEPAARGPRRSASIPLARRWRLAAVGIAVTLNLTAIVAVAVRTGDHGREITALRDKVTEPGASTFSLTSPDGAIVLPSAISADGRGYVDGGSLPVLPTDRTYQLWGVADERRTSLGVLGPDPGVVPFDPQRFTAFAITAEVAGGADASLGAAIVSGAVAR